MSIPDIRIDRAIEKQLAKVTGLPLVVWTNKSPNFSPPPDMALYVLATVGRSTEEKVSNGMTIGKGVTYVQVRFRFNDKQAQATAEQVAAAIKAVFEPDTLIDIVNVDKCYRNQPMVDGPWGVEPVTLAWIVWWPTAP